MDKLKELKQQAENLKDTIEQQNIERMLLENELAQLVEPAKAIMALNQILLEMLMENNVFMRANGAKEKAVLHKNRLLKMINLLGPLSDLDDSNYKLRTINREMNVALHKEKMLSAEYKSQLDKITNAIEF